MDCVIEASGVTFLVVRDERYRREGRERGGRYGVREGKRGDWGRVVSEVRERVKKGDEVEGMGWLAKKVKG